MTSLENFMHIGLTDFLTTDDDQDVDWHEHFGISMQTGGGVLMQVLRTTQQVSTDGYLHIKIPPHFTAKRVEIIVLPIADSTIVPFTTSVKEPESEWDIDYESHEISTGQTFHTFELLEYECGAEDESKWK